MQTPVISNEGKVANSRNLKNSKRSGLSSYRGSKAAGGRTQPALCECLLVPDNTWCTKWDVHTVRPNTH